MAEPVEDLRNQVRLELVKVDVERTIESKGGGYGRYDLGDEAIEVCEAWRRDAEVLLVDVVNSFVINLTRGLVSKEIYVLPKGLP